MVYRLKDDHYQLNGLTQSQLLSQSGEVRASWSYIARIALENTFPLRLLS